MNSDAQGKNIVLAYAEHEILWIKAANTLPRAERALALEDIALMCCRTFANVRKKAEKLRQEEINARWAASRRIMAVQGKMPGPPAEMPYPIQPPSLASRMALNGKLAKARSILEG